MIKVINKKDLIESGRPLELALEEDRLSIYEVEALPGF